MFIVFADTNVAYVAIGDPSTSATTAKKSSPYRPSMNILSWPIEGSNTPRTLDFGIIKLTCVSFFVPENMVPVTR